MSPAGPPDENLTDDDLQSEIEMVSELVLAATSSDGPLPQDEVDLLLGVHPGRDDTAGSAGSAGSAAKSDS
jgi:hypothetical protein